MIEADVKAKAQRLLTEWKGASYSYGLGVMDDIGRMSADIGKRAALIINPNRKDLINNVIASLEAYGVIIAGDEIIEGARPNSPVEDIERISKAISAIRADCIIAVGGGSLIDAGKAANVLAGLHVDTIDMFFGTGLVTKALESKSQKLLPLLAVQTASSSGSHLTKYANVTDMSLAQKKLIIDDAIIPQRAVFDYGVTVAMPEALTIDGIMDGLSHCLEVFYGASANNYELISDIALTAIWLILTHSKTAITRPEDTTAREALGLATDLGGYAIMVGGTSGAHLNSFSFVDITTHGRACGIMNLYYTVLFSTAIENQLRSLVGVLCSAGFIGNDSDVLARDGRDLGIAVAQGLMAFAESLGAPTKLSQLAGFNSSYIDKALIAAKNPQLESKLRNMPIPMNADEVDVVMGSVLKAAIYGDFSLIA